MRMLGKRDLGASAKPNEDGTRVLIAIGGIRFTAVRSEAIQLATEIVAAVGQLGPRQDETDAHPGGGSAA